MGTVVFTVCSMGCLPKTACHSLIRLQDTNVWRKELRDNVQTRKIDEKEEGKEDSNLPCAVAEKKMSTSSKKTYILLCSKFATFRVTFELHERSQIFIDRNQKTGTTLKDCYKDSIFPFWEIYPSIISQAHGDTLITFPWKLSISSSVHSSTTPAFAF